MNHLFRLIDNGIVDFFVQNSKDSRYLRDQFLKNSPYLLNNRKLDCLPEYFPCSKEVKVCVSGRRPFHLPCWVRYTRNILTDNASENGIEYDIVVFELAAMFPQLEFLAEFHKHRNGKVAMFSMIFCLTLFSNYVEVKKNLQDSVRYYYTEAFEAKNSLVCQMAVNPSDILKYA